MNMNMKQFDERQLQVRGKIFYHGFFVAVMLLLLNAFLQSEDIVWASPFNQNILILVAIIAVVSMESILRGAYFGKLRRPWVLLALFGVLSLGLAVSLIMHFAHGAVFVDRMGLSGEGVTAVVSAVFITITVTAIVKMVVDQRKERE